MGLVSIQLVTKEADGSLVRIPVISPSSIEETVKNLYKTKKWNIVLVTDNAGSYEHTVVEGEIDKGLVSRREVGEHI